MDVYASISNLDIDIGLNEFIEIDETTEELYYYDKESDNYLKNKNIEIDDELEELILLF